MGAAWLVTVFGGMAALTQYAGTPGSQPPAPATWPAVSKLAHESAKPTLVMFIHPQCPCSKASVAELEKLMGEQEGRLKAHVVMLDPETKKEACCRGDLWNQVEGIRGLSVWTDDSGNEARLFHAETSGQTVLYDRDGRLVFQGGVTVSRGHRGESPGMQAVRAVLENHLPAPVEASVFGCALFNQNPQGEPVPCKRL
jgi:hypothetical protein